VRSQVHIEEIKAIVKIVTSNNVRRIAEVGVGWGGTGFAMLCNEGMELYAVDIWEDEEVYKDYIDSIAKTAGYYKIVPIKLPSVIAASIFDDGFFDLVFIDADHRYKSVKEDLLAWLPKTKIICGHDCSGKYTHYSHFKRLMIDKHKDNDDLEGVYSGVVRALYDVFNDDYKWIRKTRIWWKDTTK